MNYKRLMVMYDVRGKQDYIYRSNRIKESVGASCIIRDVFSDYLYSAARKVRNEAVLEYAADAKDEAIYCYEKGGKEIEALMITGVTMSGFGTGIGSMKRRRA